MPNPTRPNVTPIWTVGNTPQRTQPTNGEQFAGFSMNQRPDPKWHNWLWGIMSDWIAWFDFITNNVANLPVSNVGHHVATATNLQGQLDQLDAVLSTLGLITETPTGVVDGTNLQFRLSQAPINASSVVAFIDGREEGFDVEYTVQQISGQWYVVFTSGDQPQDGETPNVLYMTGSSGVGVGGGVGAIANDSGGVGLFDQMVINVAKFKALKAGVNVNIVDNLDGTVSISAVGGGGGSIETHGSAAAPIQIDPTVGITPTAAAEQVWWIKPTTGLLGAQPITAMPAIAAGSFLGQRLKLKSVAVVGGAGYLSIPNGGSAGTDMDGPCDMGPYAQAIDYTWDGTNWSEDSRRV